MLHKDKHQIKVAEAADQDKAKKAEREFLMTMMMMMTTMMMMTIVEMEEVEEE